LFLLRQFQEFICVANREEFGKLNFSERAFDFKRTVKKTHVYDGPFANPNLLESFLVIFLIPFIVFVYFGRTGKQ